MAFSPDIPEETLPKREIVVSAALKLTSQLLPFFLQESRDGRGKGEALLSVMSGHLTSDARGKKGKRGQNTRAATACQAAAAAGEEKEWGPFKETLKERQTESGKPKSVRVFSPDKMETKCQK